MSITCVQTPCRNQTDIWYQIIQSNSKRRLIGRVLNLAMMFSSNELFASKSNE